MQRASVDYVLVGGLAVSLQGAVRGTLDVDVVLAMTDDNLARFIDAARTMGLASSLPVPIQALTDSALIDRWFEEKHILSVASVPHLIALKSGTGRSIDALDIEQLRKIHRDVPST